MKKTILATCMVGALLASAVGTYAMSDEDFKNAILDQLKTSYDFSIQELEEIKDELEDISRDDILDSLEDEIQDIKDIDLQSSLKKQFMNLDQINDGGQFFEVIDIIYAQIDDYYFENYDDWEEDYEYNFEEEQNYIIDGLNEEMEFVTNTELKGKVQKFIDEYKDEQDEDTFFDALDNIYGEIDSYYGTYDDLEYIEMNEFNFDDLRIEILEELNNEKKYIKNEDLKTEIDNVIDLLTDEQDEDVFFKTLDKFYENPELEAYYEAQGMQIITGDDFFSEEFDFEDGKNMMIEGIQYELEYITDEALKNTLKKELEKLEKIADEGDFFEKLDFLYEQLDEYYEENEEFVSPWGVVEMYEDDSYYEIEDQDAVWIHLGEAEFEEDER